MNIETVLRSAITMLGTCHVVGSEAETFAAAMKNLKAIADAIKQAKEQEGDDAE
jgi:hypothetical protein